VQVNRGQIRELGGYLCGRELFETMPSGETDPSMRDSEFGHVPRSGRRRWRHAVAPGRIATPMVADTWASNHEDIEAAKESREQLTAGEFLKYARVEGPGGYRLVTAFRQRCVERCFQYARPAARRVPHRAAVARTSQGL
jgi:hypothetical protein